MRAIENTITEYPGQANGVLDKRWVYAGNHALFTVRSDDIEVVTGIAHVIGDLFQNSTDVFVSEGFATIEIRSEYTTNFDRVNSTLANAAEHYGVEPITWFSGVPQVAKALDQGREVI